jgi:2,4-dienoyl-CoA reductase-like NADH-dependent reductase (Old Yellow Enzyme family)
MYKEMFQPITIGNVALKNRLVMAPTTTNFAQGGYPTEQFMAFLAARAKGGVGLIVTPPALNLFPGGTVHLVFPLLSEKEHMPLWNEVVETIHAFGAKAFGQVMVGGSGRQVGPGALSKAPSPVPIVSIPEENIPRQAKAYEARKGLPSLWAQYKDLAPPQELSVEEIVWLEDAYAKTALMMKGCGFDGVELHFAHGYLGSSFLSARTNHRTDAYGGSLEKRGRLLYNSVAKTRAAVGSDFVVGVRMTGTEHMPQGITIAESAHMARAAEQEGLDYVHLTGGCWEAAKWYLPEEDGTMLDEAAAMKAVLKIPVITPAIHTPENAENAIAHGKTDMVSLCRPLIADPQWVAKVANGEEHTIRKCIRCLGCLHRLRRSLGLRCEVNREVGQERYNPAYYRLSAPGWKKYCLP